MPRSRLFSGLAAGATVAAAASLTALSGTTAQAQTTVPGWPSNNGGGSATSATGSGAATTWTLRTGSAGETAAIEVDYPASELAPYGTLSPDTAPTFTVASANSVPNTGLETANPRWVIALHNYCVLEGGTGAGGQTAGNNGQWIAIRQPWWDGGGETVGPTNWRDALAAAGGSSSSSDIGCYNNEGHGAWLQWANLIAGSPASTTYTLTHVTFAGRPVIDAHTLPAFSESATGAIRNFATGKCLDVANGNYRAGAPLQQWTCGASFHGVPGANQNFRIVEQFGGASALMARGPSGHLWYVTVNGAGQRLTLTNHGANPMDKQGPFYSFPNTGISKKNSPVDLDMTAIGAGNGGHVLGLTRIPDNAQRWHLPETP